MRTVAIIGLGLMGGSLGLALKKRGAFAVHGWTRSPETAAAAVSRGAVDVMHDSLVDAVREADLVIYCAPILRIPGLVADSLDALKPGALLTDVGSTKQQLRDALEPLLAGRSADFIGSHPICGSEKTGIDAARDNLYQDAVVVVTPDPTSPPPRITALTRFWQLVGSQVHVTTPEQHDRLLARTSHLPHMIASLLATVVGRVPEDHLGPFCGTGYRDATRLADGSPEIWHDILMSNRDSVRQELTAFSSALEDLIERLDKQDADGIQQVLERGKQARQDILL